MANEGIGFGAFANGLSNGYSQGRDLERQIQQKNLQDERDRQEELQRQQEEQRQRMAQQQQGAQSGDMGGMGMSTALSAFGSNGGAAGGATAGGGTATGGTGAMGLPTSFGAYAGGGGSAGGGAGGSAAGGGLAAAGPWAALAAVIAVNEKSARNGGHRADGWQYGKDLLGGKVVEQDANGRWSKMLGGYDNDKTGLLNDAGAGAEFTTLDFKNGFKKLTNAGTLHVAAKGLKKLF